jgi:hypothetical protein
MSTYAEEQTRDCQVRFFFGSILRFLMALPMAGVCLGLGGAMAWYSLQVFHALEQRLHTATARELMAHLTRDQEVWLVGPACLSLVLLGVGLWYAGHLPQRYRCLVQAFHNVPSFFPPR